MSIPNLYDDDRRSAYLTTIPEHLRSRASNLVLARIRGGATKPETAYALTVLKVRRDLGGWGAEDENARTILAALIRHRTEAIAYCAWCLEWERLTPIEKDRLREVRGEEYRHAHMDAQPPTERQVAYLRRLGHTGEVRSKRHASALIDGLLKARVA